MADTSGTYRGALMASGAFLRPQLRRAPKRNIDSTLPHSYVLFWIVPIAGEKLLLTGVRSGHTGDRIVWKTDIGIDSRK